MLCDYLSVGIRLRPVYSSLFPRCLTELF